MVLVTQQADKPIVITGARGYIGHALVNKLAGEGYALRLVSRSAGAWSGDAAAAIELVQADLRDEAKWYSLLDGANAVIHLSARTDLRAAEVDPAVDRDLNVAPVRALVRAAERSGTQIPVIFASTVTIVGAVHANPVNERTPDNPCSVYDRHKLECETILRKATEHGILRACSLRFSNIYGYGGGVFSINANRGILNTAMRRAWEGRALTLYGAGEYIRDFIFVSDAVDAFWRALQSDTLGDGSHYVIATGRGRTLGEAFDLVAKEAFRSTGHIVEVRHVPEPTDLHPIERRNFVGDASLYQSLTGWRSRVDLEAGIRDYFARCASGGGSGSAPEVAA